MKEGKVPHPYLELLQQRQRLGVEPRGFGASARFAAAVPRGEGRTHSRMSDWLHGCHQFNVFVYCEITCPTRCGERTG
jgi:hypothetical protein